MTFKRNKFHTERCPDDTALTPSFNDVRKEFFSKSLGHPWRYFVAGGETLRMLEKCIDEAIAAKTGGVVEQMYKDYALQVGATGYDRGLFSFEYEDTDFIPRKVGDAAMRFKRNPDFMTYNPQAGFLPDPETTVGKIIIRDIFDLSLVKDAPKRFAEWLENNAVRTNQNMHPRFGEGSDIKSAEALKIGGDWIIRVPVIGEGIYGEDGKGGVLTGYRETWVLPPDSKPLRVSEFFRLLETEGAITMTPEEKTPKAPTPSRKTKL